MKFNLIKLNKLNKKPLIICLVLSLVFGIVGFMDIKSNAAENIYNASLTSYSVTYENGNFMNDSSDYKEYSSNSTMYLYTNQKEEITNDSRVHFYIISESYINSNYGCGNFTDNNGKVWYYSTGNSGSKYLSGYSGSCVVTGNGFEKIYILNKVYEDKQIFISDYKNGVLDYTQDIDYDNFLTNNNITHTQNDYNVIPDKYNTGVNKNISLTPVTDTIFIETSNGVPLEITYRIDSDYYVINQYANVNIPDEIVVENYDFTSLSKFLTTNIARYETRKTIIFNNCKFNGIQHSGYGSSQVDFIFNNCTFNGCIVASDVTLNNCLIENTNTADGLKLAENASINNCFVSNLMNNSVTYSSHTDGVQFTGYQDSITKNVHFNNVRFAFPQFYWDGTNVAAANAAIMLSMEYSDADNITFENIIIDMGSKYYPIYNVDSDNWNETNIVFKNIKVSDTYDTIFYTSSYNNEATVENVDFNSKLYVSSIWKDDSSKTHIICTNNTKINKTLKIVTNLGEYSFDINRSPSQYELLNDTTYQSYTYEDMPYDVEFIIEEDINYLVCYDTDISEENQIRYVNYNEEELPEGNIIFRANIPSYFEVELPNSYQIKDLSNILNFSVSGDIPGNKKLSIGLDDECVLKNSEEQELVVELSIAKEYFLYEDIKNGMDSTITISVEKLPAGRYVGNMPVYINIVDNND